MSSYESLLEAHVEDERLAKVTFTEMQSMLESLTDFVNEEVELKVEFTLQEAEGGVDEESKSKKVSAAVTKAKNSLIEKLTAFIKKIGDAVKAFVAKAKMVVKQGGNVAIGKMLKNNNIKIRKEFTIKKVDGGAQNINYLYGEAAKAASEIDTAIKQVNINTVPVTVPEVPAKVQDAIDAFAKKFEDSSVVKNEVVKVDTYATVSAAYDKIVKPYLDAVQDGITNVEKVCGAAQKQAKDIIGKLKKNDAEKTVNADGISRVSKLSTAAMQLSTATVRFANSVLTIATKNAAKLALAAGANAPAAAKDKAGEAKASAKAKLDNAKSSAKAAIDAKKTGMSGKNAGAIQKQED